MKLLIITNYLPKYSIEFLLILKKKLTKINFKLSIFADIKNDIDVNQYDKKYDFKVQHLSILNFKYFIIRPLILRKILNLKPDKIIMYGNPRDLSIYLALIFCKVLGIKTYIYGMFHSLGNTRFVSKLSYYFFYYFSDGCLTYGKRGFNVLNSLNLNPLKITIVGNAINEKKITSIKKNKKFTKKKCFIILKTKYPNLKSNIILQVVRMSSIKKPLLLVEAAKILLKQKKDITFVIIGEGEYYDKFNLLVKKYKLENHFLILGKLYHEEYLARWFLVSKIFVVPSCIGLSIYHSFAYGIPVITDNDIKKQSSEFEILKENYNGLTYNYNNPNDLSNKILRILNNKLLQKKLSKNAVNTIFNGNRMEDKVNRFIEAVRKK